LTIRGPIVIFGTKCPSITSTCIQSAPAASAAWTSSPSFEKSADNIEGAIIFISKKSPIGLPVAIICDAYIYNSIK